MGCNGATTSDAPACALDATASLDTAPEAGHAHPLEPTPSIYVGLRNPYGYDDPSKAALGAALYAAECARCHGVTGKGDGPEATQFTPRPVDLNDTNAHHPDPYIVWRVHDGGQLACSPSDMPAFGGKLSDDDLWRIITYLRFTFLAF